MKSPAIVAMSSAVAAVPARDATVSSAEVANVVKGRYRSVLAETNDSRSSSVNQTLASGEFLKRSANQTRIGDRSSKVSFTSKTITGFMATRYKTFPSWIRGLWL